MSDQIVNFRHGAQIKNVRRAHDTLPASIPHLYFMLSLATIDSAYNLNDKKDIKSWISSLLKFRYQGDCSLRHGELSP